MEQVAEELSEALRQRLVEAETPLDLLDDVERRLRPGKGTGWVVGCDVEEDEHHQADGEHRQQSRKDAAEDEADDHAGSLTAVSTRLASKASRSESPRTLRASVSASTAQAGTTTIHQATR